MEENYYWCHRPLDLDFDGIWHDCDNYIECEECPYYNDYEEDD